MPVDPLTRVEFDKRKKGLTVIFGNPDAKEKKKRCRGSLMERRGEERGKQPMEKLSNWGAGGGVPRSSGNFRKPN